jgi:hypothetical protein
MLSRSPIRVTRGARPHSGCSMVRASKWTARATGRPARSVRRATRPWTDRTVWNEHDLAGTLFARDFVQDALDQLPPSLRERMARWVAESDERFRSYTVDDPAGRMAKVARIDLAGRPWWWRRVPDSGPITEDLARY